MNNLEHGGGTEHKISFSAKNKPEQIVALPEKPNEQETNQANDALTKEMPPEAQAQTVTDLNEGLNDFAKKEKEREMKEEDKANPLEMARKFYGEHKEIFDQGIKLIKELFEQGKTDEARQKAQQLINDIKQKADQYFSGKVDQWFSDYNKKTGQAEAEADPAAKQELTKLAIEGVDYIPVVGSMKKISEGAAGRKLSGEKLGGWKKLWHAVEGGALLMMDLTASESKTDDNKASKLLTRSAALMRKIGLSRKAYQPVYKVGKVIEKNPWIANAATKALRYTIARRQQNKTDWIKSVKKTISSDKETPTMAA